MRLIYKSYKFRIYPTKEQESLLSKHFGHCRFVYNYFLNQRIEKYNNDKISLNYYDNSRELTILKKNEDFSWLKQVNSTSLIESLKNLDSAYVRFFKKENKFPRFKSKYSKQSFKVIQSTSIKDGKLKIPKFKKGIKINIHRQILGKIKFATISKTKTGKYYISITCENEYMPYEKTNKSVGIDTGLKQLAVLSDGNYYENIKTLKNKLTKLKYEQRQLSKKLIGTTSRNRQRKKFSLLHEKITNIRKDYLNKVSTEIIKNHDIIAVEDLAIKNLIKNHRLAQAISDVSLGVFYKMLGYKSSWNCRQFVKIDRFFPSSKTCSSCGFIKEELSLSIRNWVCESCGKNHDRDINAAKNILNEGIKKLSGCGIQSDTKQKHSEASPLGESLTYEAKPLDISMVGIPLLL